MLRPACQIVAVFLSHFALCTAIAAGLFGGGTGSISGTSESAKNDERPAKSRATTDVSDLWWNLNESGWGMQLVQNNNFVFATLFVYGPDGKPTWYTAPLNNAGGFTWSGPLYATAGPWFASFFNPNSVAARQVGTLTFQATDIANGVLTYSVDGVAVTKTVTRETLASENIGGSYQIIGSRDKVCVLALGSGHDTIQAPFSISHTGSSVSGVTGGCSFTGTYGQNGKLGIATGTYACTTGEVGSFIMSEIMVTETGVMLRLVEHSNFCSSISVQAAGIRQ